MSSKAPATRWVAGTAGLCVAGLVGSWTLVLGPQLDAAAATRQQAAQVREQNTVLASHLAALKADHARIGDYHSDLAALRRQIPDDARLSQLSREIDGAARAARVTLVRVEAGDAMDLATAATAAPAAATEATGDTAAATGDTAAAADGTADAAAGTSADAAAAPATPAVPAVAPPGPPPVPGLLAIPITTTVAGSVEQVRTFIAALQTGLERRVLVTTLNVRALEESTGEGSTRAAAAGDVEAVVGAYAYVLPDRSGVVKPRTGKLPKGTGGGGFLASPPAADPAAGPAPDPAAEAADAIAAAVEERLAASTAAAEAAAAASAAAAESARAAAAEKAAAAAAAAAPAATPAPTAAPATDG